MQGLAGLRWLKTKRDLAACWPCCCQQGVKAPCSSSHPETSGALQDVLESAAEFSRIRPLSVCFRICSLASTLVGLSCSQVAAAEGIFGLLLAALLPAAGEGFLQLQQPESCNCTGCLSCRPGHGVSAKPSPPAAQAAHAPALVELHARGLHLEQLIYCGMQSRQQLCQPRLLHPLSLCQQ